MSNLRLCIVIPTIPTVSETFLRAHIERLPFDTSVIVGNGASTLNGTPLAYQGNIAKSFRKALRMLLNLPYEWDINRIFLRELLRTKADVVLAEYGPTAVTIMEACKKAKIPLVAHFHGYDASKYSVLDEYAAHYCRLWDETAAIVTGSESMSKRLTFYGAPTEKLIVNYVSTVDQQLFKPCLKLKKPGAFVAVGRFVEKKGPHLTLLAFAEVHKRLPQTTLTMIGDGPLVNACKDLVAALNISDHVRFLGSQPTDVVNEELASGSCFVQHSLTSFDGDCEGTAISILEAGAMGIPIVSTFHEGIAETMINEKTALLVNERDIEGMASAMYRIQTDDDLARRLSIAAHERVTNLFNQDRSINGLAEIIKCVASRKPIALIKRQLEDYI